MLTDPQIERYARHVLLREVGGAGQERLLAARVAVAGLSPVGAWATAYLALAGVGRLELCDDAAVGPDELPPLLGPADPGRPRAAALAEAVAAYNPDVAARAVRAVVGPVEAVIATAPEAVPAAPGAPVVVAFAAGDRAVVGVLDEAGPCAACVARAVGPAAPATPAAALVGGSLAATAVLARLAANAPPAPGFLVAEGGSLRRLDAAGIGCPHRR